MVLIKKHCFEIILRGDVIMYLSVHKSSVVRIKLNKKLLPICVKQHHRCKKKNVFPYYYYSIAVAFSFILSISHECPISIS